MRLCIRYLPRHIRVRTSLPVRLCLSERNSNIMIIMIIRKCMVFLVQNSTLTFRFASCLFSYYLRGLPFIPQSFYLFFFCFAFQSNSHSRSPWHSLCMLVGLVWVWFICISNDWSLFLCIPTSPIWNMESFWIRNVDPLVALRHDPSPGPQADSHVIIHIRYQIIFVYERWITWLKR